MSAFLARELPFGLAGRAQYARVRPCESLMTYTLDIVVIVLSIAAAAFFASAETA